MLGALGDGRRAFAEIAREVMRAELAAEVAPYLVPDPLDAASRAPTCSSWPATWAGRSSPEHRARSTR